MHGQGCVCPPKEFNLLHGFRISMTYWKTMNVVLNEGSQQCTIGLVNSAKTKSNEHKIKARTACCVLWLRWTRLQTC